MEPTPITGLEDTPPLEQGGANEPPAPLSFSADQQIQLFGGPAEPGAEYTITVRAGEPSPEGGDLTFEVVSNAEAPEGPAEMASEPPGEQESDPLESPPIEDDPAATKALGYDRSALMRGRSKKETPKMGAAFLED